MGKKLYSDDELLNRLQKFAEKLGRPPSQSEMDDSGPHASKTYGNRFESWNNALLRRVPASPSSDTRERESGRHPYSGDTHQQRGGGHQYSRREATSRGSRL
ncbi:homing endonuclease associated repeat-containing protein [Natrinema gari]|uniref:homing endonuclease associated repeat-containing protein n=1 Tax=Natrinema gari TaxID=419186 RepID=UPI00373AE83F